VEAKKKKKEVALRAKWRKDSADKAKKKKKEAKLRTVTSSSSLSSFSTVRRMNEGRGALFFNPPWVKG
jgi:hypothetical protein